MCWVGVVLLNCFFIYFSLVRGLQRGRRWQMGYMVASIIQLIVEIFLYETSECIWVHFLIPDTVSADIRSIQTSLRKTVDEMVLTNNPDWETYPLDAPTYLFLSTNLAKRFPDLIESMIILSYHHYLPGEVSKQWIGKHGSGNSSSETIDSCWWKTYSNFFRRFSVSAATVSILKYIGSSPPSLQRVMIHSLQPIVLTAVAVAGYYFISNPALFTIFAVVPLYCLYKYVESVYLPDMQPVSKVAPSPEDHVEICKYPHLGTANGTSHADDVQPFDGCNSPGSLHSTCPKLKLELPCEDVGDFDPPVPAVSVPAASNLSVGAMSEPPATTVARNTSTKLVHSILVEPSSSSEDSGVDSESSDDSDDGECRSSSSGDEYEEEEVSEDDTSEVVRHANPTNRTAP